MLNFNLVHWIDLNITDLCNLTCSFCPRHDAEIWPNNNEHMDLDLLEKITTDLINANYRGQLSFTGKGESTLHPQFDECFKILHRKDRTYSTNLTTNGRKLNVIWDKWVKHFDRSVINTYTNVEEYKDRLKKYRYQENGLKVQHWYKPDRLSMKKLDKDFLFFVNNRAGLIATDHKINLNTPCLHPFTNLFINFDGEYQLCCNDWQVLKSFGNVRNENIVDIYMNNHEMNHTRYQLLNGNRTCQEACINCDMKFYSTETRNNVLNNEKLMNKLKSDSESYK